MYNIRKRFTVLTVSFLLIVHSVPSFSIIGDGGAGWAQIPYFIRLISEQVKRYKQLKMMISTVKDQENYLKLINAGLENSIGLLNSLPVKDEKLLADLKSFQQSYDSVTKVYGQIPKSKEAVLHLLHDQTVAESIKMVNGFKRYSLEQEENSMKIAIQSRQASPKGAQRMQAETSAQILRSLSQLIRLNTQLLKLQSESLAMENKQDKDSIHEYQKLSKNFNSGFNNLNLDMTLQRY